MQIEKIEELSKKLHQFAEEYEYACKAGSGFGASEVVGKLTVIIPYLREMAWDCHGNNQPHNNPNELDLLPSEQLKVSETDTSIKNQSPYICP